MKADISILDNTRAFLFWPDTIAFIITQLVERGPGVPGFGSLANMFRYLCEALVCIIWPHDCFDETAARPADPLG